ncbi:MAG: hypothetical protein IMF01_04795 [Proteobacteria bacterium]|nr:hypothetical protein [Pseudomonadota bacterium]
MNKQQEEMIAQLLNSLPPEMRAMAEKEILRRKKEGLAEAVQLSEDMAKLISSETQQILQIHLAKIMEKDDDLGFLVSLVLFESLTNKVEIRKLRKEMADIRKAHAAWISDSINKDKL